MTPNVMSVEYWRERAEEAQVKAEAMRDPNAKATLLRLAKNCEKVAERAEAARNAEKEQF